MKKTFILIISIILTANLNAQDVLDTIYFTNGKVEAVQITGLSETAVQYNYFGENIPISTPKAKILSVKTRSGRVVEFENTTIEKTVNNCKDWENVVVTVVQKEVESMVRTGNVSGKAKGATTMTSASKMQDRAMNKMKMQSAFRGSDLIFSINQQVEGSSSGGGAWSNGGFASSKTAEANMTGTSYSVKTITPFLIQSGEYILKEAYRLNPNDYQLKQLDVSQYLVKLFVDSKIFLKEGPYYQLHQDAKVPRSNNEMKLIQHDGENLVFLVIETTKQGKIRYYNLFYSKM